MKKMLSILLAMFLLVSAAGAALAEYTVNPELADSTATLSIYGPGCFNNEEDTTDLVTGVATPGYHVVIERWAELYPNVTLEIEGIGWDSWQTAITTACLSGEIDVIVHGATMTDLTLDLTSYIEAEPEYREQISATASRITTENPGAYKVSGISYNISPMLVWLDTEIFEHYGVELPTADWTFEDLKNIAAQLTGTDPVTGEQTYGLLMNEMGANNLWMNYVLCANALGATVYDYGETFEETKVDYLSEESIAAFQMIADLAQYCSPEAKEGLAVDYTMNGTNNWAIAFREGIASYKELVANGTEGRYVAITAPICTAGRYEGLPTPHAGDGNLAIYKDSPDADLAWEFIKFMTTDEEMIQWLADVGNLPNNKDSGEALKSYINDDALIETVMSALNSIPENYNNATNYVMNNVSYGPTTANLITAVSNVINGYSTPEEAAQLMQDGIDEYLANLS